MKRLALFTVATVFFIGCDDATQPVDDELAPAFSEVDDDEVADDVVYSNDFEGPVGPEWSNTSPNPPRRSILAPMTEITSRLSTGLSDRYKLAVKGRHET